MVEGLGFYSQSGERMNEGELECGREGWRLDGDVMKGLISLIRQMRWVLLAGLFVSYFGSLWVGAMHFPHGYDWRRNVISNLLSPRDNPEWYRVPSVGVATAGVWMVLLGIWIESELGETGGLNWRVRRGAFLAGVGCLVLSALVAPQHVHTVMGLRHAHELLARTAAVCLGVGMLCACGAPTERMGGNWRALRIGWGLATVPPIVGAVGSGLVVAAGRMGGLGMAELLKGTVFWHLAFWEWVGSGAVFMFFACGVGMMRKG
jgi:hypothetical protein